MQTGRHYRIPAELRRERERALFASGFLWGVMVTLAAAVAVLAVWLNTL